jgi:hypothetical protein
MSQQSIVSLGLLSSALVQLFRHAVEPGTPRRLKMKATTGQATDGGQNVSTCVNIRN